MVYDFDEIIDRRPSGSFKWNQYDQDILPMFVADMDFRCPQPILDALSKQIEHGVFGYAWPDNELRDLISERMHRFYNWTVLPEEIVFLPGIVSGFNVACRAVGDAYSSAFTFTPIYPPFLTAPANQDIALQSAQLKVRSSGQILKYEIDFNAFESALTKSTNLLLLCHPHNPVGREFTREELKQLGDICVKHNMVICSDEIHCDLLLGGTRHLPMACVSSEIADRCITLMSPSKSFNVSGLGPSYAIIQNKELRKQYKKAGAMLPEINVCGIAAFKAGYQHCAPWLEELLKYLTENRDIYADFVINNFPEVKTTIPEATYLAWLDFRESGIEGSSYNFFLKNAKVAMNDGKLFGEGGEGFLRFNFACPRSLMLRALEQMKTAFNQRTILAAR
jgi:cystathionine beta-lyase